MRKNSIFLVVFIIAMLLILGLTGCQSKKETAVIEVGGKNFSEQYIMAEMLSMLIEGNTDLKTNITTNLAGTTIFDAIKAKQIDVYLEYTGTGLVNLQMEMLKNTEEVYNAVKKAFDEQLNIKWMKPYGFNNTYAMIVTKETAEKYNLKTISDLAEVADRLVLGCTYVFTERSDGYPGLSEYYGFKFADVKCMDPSLMYQAVVQGSVDVISGFATEGRIPSFGLIILEDDKQFFPPYDATAIIRGEVLEAHPELEEVLNKLAGRIDDTKMAQLNAQVDLDKREPADVARDFLKEEGLIK